MKNLRQIIKKSVLALEKLLRGCYGFARLLHKFADFSFLQMHKCMEKLNGRQSFSIFAFFHPLLPHLRCKKYLHISAYIELAN
jgi:hypothetical protein